MKNLFLFCLLFFSFLSCKTTDLKTVSEQILSSGTPLSTAEVVGGLKEALKFGAQFAGSQASQNDGFYKNAQLFIPFPKELKKVESTLNDLGLNSLTRDFVKSLNRGAEKAAAHAKPIFWKAITSMSIQDAWGILKGEDQAATQYLKRVTHSELFQIFRPVIQRSLKEVDATRYWGDISGRYNAIPFVKPVQTDLNSYVTQKALDGLFILVAAEEKKIRKNPLAYSNGLIRRVFSEAQ